VIEQLHKEIDIAGCLENILDAVEYQHLIIAHRVKIDKTISVADYLGVSEKEAHHMKRQFEFQRQTGQSYISRQLLKRQPGKWPKYGCNCEHVSSLFQCNELTECDRLQNHFRFVEKAPRQKPLFILKTTRPTPTIESKGKIRPREVKYDYFLFKVP